MPYLRNNDLRSVRTELAGAVVEKGVSCELKSGALK